MNMSSSVIANLVSFFLFQEQEVIQEESWVLLGAILTAVTGSGILVVFLMRPTPWAHGGNQQVPRINIQFRKNSSPKMLRIVKIV